MFHFDMLSVFISFTPEISVKSFFWGRGVGNIYFFTIFMFYQLYIGSDLWWGVWARNREHLF